MENKLLEKAMSLKRYRRKSKLEVTEDHFELVKKWMQDDLSLEQIAFGLDMKTGSAVFCKMICILKESYKKGFFKL